MDLSSIRAEIDLIYNDVVELRRHLHMYPELSQQEEKTMAFISDYLTKLDIAHQINIGGFGIVATIGNPKAEYAVAIRADMDALPVYEKNDEPYVSRIPGMMHACGHDIHMATLMGTARILKKMEQELTGAVKLFFQPAEESGGGAERMIRAGCLQNPPVKRVIGFHIDPKKTAGMVTFSPQIRSASSTDIKITIHGKASHGAEPEKGIDAVLVASQTVVALQSIASRSIAPTTPIVLTMGIINGGTKRNIVANSVTIEGTLRATDCETRDFAKERIRAIVNSTATMYGGSADVEINDAYPPVINNKDCTMRIMALANDLLGEENVSLAECPTMTAEDVSYFLNEVPGTFFDLGCSQKDCAYEQNLHNGHLCPDENCMRVGMMLEVMGTLMFLEDCELWQRKV